MGWWSGGTLVGQNWNNFYCIPINLFFIFHVSNTLHVFIALNTRVKTFFLANYEASSFTEALKRCRCPTGVFHVENLLHQVKIKYWGNNIPIYGHLRIFLRVIPYINLYIYAIAINKHARNIYTSNCMDWFY